MTCHLFPSASAAEQALPDARLGEVVAYARTRKLACRQVLQVVLVGKNASISGGIPSLLEAELAMHAMTRKPCARATPSVAILRH